MSIKIATEKANKKNDKCKCKQISPAMRLPLVLELLVVLADEVSADASLKVGDDLTETLVSHVLEGSEDAGLEEDLGVSQTVVVLIQLQRVEHLLSDHLAVDETWRNHVRRQNRIPADVRYNIYHQPTKAKILGNGGHTHTRARGMLLK